MAKSFVLADHLAGTSASHRAWKPFSAALGGATALAGLVTAPAAGWFLQQPLTRDAWRDFLGFFPLLADSDRLIAAHAAVLASTPEAALTAYAAALGLGAAVTGITLLCNPFMELPMIYGEADWADDKTLALMEERRQLGRLSVARARAEPREQGVAFLGAWPRGGEIVTFHETLSLLCLAPPGTGKTAAFVVPTLLTGDNASFIINDTKPELYAITGAHREAVSHCFMMDWSKVDDPANGVFYPRYNPLSPKVLPPHDSPRLDTVIDALAQTMIPEKPGGNGGNDYFVNKGRAAMTGFLHLINAKVNVARDYADLPAEWVGREASIGMLSDWYVQAQAKAAEAASTDNQDPQRAFFLSLAKLAAQLADKHGCSRRAFNEIQSLVDMAPNERSGILGSMDEAFLPFKNAAVKQRTSACDFTPGDFRGLAGPDGAVKPLTLYICVNQAEAKAFSRVTALFYQSLSQYLLSYGPGEIDERDRINAPQAIDPDTGQARGRKLGPYPAAFLLDEFAKLPKIEAVMSGPDLGRSKATSYLLFAQDYGQIGLIYSENEIEIINTTTAAKIVLAQNNAKTVKRFIEMVGKTTIRKVSDSQSVGIGKTVNPWQANRSESLEGVEFLRVSDITAMPPGQHIVLMQNFLNRPMKLKTAFFFNDPAMAGLCFNLKTLKGPRARAYAGEYMDADGRQRLNRILSPMPEFIAEQRLRDWRAAQARQAGQIPAGGPAAP